MGYGHFTPEQHQQITQIVREAVQATIPATVNHTVPEAISQTLKSFGFKVEDITSIQEDQAFLRKQRRGSENIKWITIKTCWGAVIAGGLAVMMMGIKAWIATITSRGGP